MVNTHGKPFRFNNKLWSGIGNSSPFLIIQDDAVS